MTYLARVAPGPWPLPDEIPVSLRVPGSEERLAGIYRKVDQSQIAEDHPGLARGAQYEWETA